ncbi:MAG: hypothetical protein WCJ72_11685 [Chryseobacterium sp.]
MKNLFLTWASKINESTWPYYQVYFDSVSRINKDDDFVCLTDSLEEKYIDKIVINYNCRIQFVKTKTKNIFTERWLAYWNFLKNKSYENVFISDSKDVFIQEYPFEILKSEKVQLVLTKEGFLHKESPFNMKDQLNLQVDFGDTIENYTDWPVVNAGVCCGKYPLIFDFCFLMWSNCFSHKKCTDQAVLNFLISKIKEDSRYHITDPNHDSFCLTGEVLKEKFLIFEPTIENNKVMSNTNYPFSIFHQWNRTKFAELILQMFIK